MASDHTITHPTRPVNTARTGRRRARQPFTITALALAVLAAGCTTAVSGTVQDKRSQPGRLGLQARELCLGTAKQTCTWHLLRGKYAAGWYQRCDIGEPYPACRSITYRR